MCSRFPPLSWMVCFFLGLPVLSFLANFVALLRLPPLLLTVLLALFWLHVSHFSLAYLRQLTYLSRFLLFPQLLFSWLLIGQIFSKHVKMFSPKTKDPTVPNHNQLTRPQVNPLLKLLKHLVFVGLLLVLLLLSLFVHVHQAPLQAKEPTPRCIGWKWYWNVYT